MEKRLAKINFSAAGGTASKGAHTCKVTLPTAWVEALGLKLESRDVELSFDGNTIILARPRPGQEFTTQKRKLGHLRAGCAFMTATDSVPPFMRILSDETFVVENHIENPVKTAFGNNPLPNWADLQAFLQDRCIPRERAGLREYLEALGIDEYDPLKIIQRTGGRMAEDHQWLEVDELS